MAEHVLIPFAGEGSGSGELTWGQRGAWRSIVAGGQALTMGGVMPTPPSVTVESVAGSLRFLLARHQSLRTRLRLGPDGHVRQEVFAAGELPLEVVDVPAGEDARAVADEVRRRLQTRPYDYEHDWPVRAAAIRQDGVVTHSVVVYLHTSLDALGLTVLVRDLAGHHAGAEPEPVTALQPLELAAQEAGPTAQRQSRASLQHMESVLRGVPAVARPSTGADTDEHDTLYFWSPRLSLAVAAVADRQGIDTSPILLGAYALSLARVTGVNPVAVQLLVSNRFRPRLGGTVAPLAQVAPCLLDVADTTLAGVVGRAWRGAMSAYKHAYYDPAGRTELVRRLREERGDQVERFVFLNDRRGQGLATAAGAAPAAAGSAGPAAPVSAAGSAGSAGAAAPDRTELAARLDALRDRSTVRWDLLAGFMREAVYLDVDDRAGALELTLTVDLRILTRAGAEQVLRGMEDVAAEMALDPDAPSGVLAGSAEPVEAR
jgi:hypothetical protein